MIKNFLFSLFKILKVFWFCLILIFFDFVYFMRVLIKSILNSFRSIKYTLITFLFFLYFIYPLCWIVFFFAVLTLMCFRHFMFFRLLFRIFRLRKKKKSKAKEVKLLLRKQLRLRSKYRWWLRTIEKKGFTFLLCHFSILLLLYVLWSIFTLFWWIVVVPAWKIFVFLEDIWLALVKIRESSAYKQLVSTIEDKLEDFVFYCQTELVFKFRKFRKSFGIFILYVLKFPFYIRWTFFPKTANYIYSVLFYVSCNVLYYLLYFLRLILWYLLYIIEATIVYLLRWCIYQISIFLFICWKFLLPFWFLLELLTFRIRYFIIICQILVIDIKILLYKAYRKLIQG